MPIGQGQSGRAYCWSIFVAILFSLVLFGIVFVVSIFVSQLQNEKKFSVSYATANCPWRLGTNNKPAEFLIGNPSKMFLPAIQCAVSIPPSWAARVGYLDVLLGSKDVSDALVNPNYSSDSPQGVHAAASALCNAIWPIDCCLFHVGELPWGDRAIELRNLQMRAYLIPGVDENYHDEIPQLLSGFSFSDIQIRTFHFAAMPLSHGWCCSQLVFRYKVTSKLEIPLTFELFCRVCDNNLVILVFMHIASDNRFARDIKDIVDSIEFAGQKK